MNPRKGEIFSIDKPYEWTSFGVVSKVRYQLCKKLGVKKLKVGHAGTLDPLATGVLVLCTGKATKRIEELQAQTKEYIATLKLGATTPSFDLESEEDGVYPTEHITEELVRQVLPQFVGTIEQVPPAFSACKVDGNRAYDLARAGKEVVIKAKTLVIDEIELMEYEPGRLVLRVVCSKGTYIRALARDIGLALGSGAYLTGLCRTRVGDYNLQNSFTLESFAEWLDGQSIEIDE